MTETSHDEDRAKAPALAPRLEIHLLGEVRLSADGAPLAGFATPRLPALLCWLLLHAGVPQPRARVAALFWPDSSEEQALTNLRKALFDLRHALPAADQFLILDRATVSWRAQAPYTVDVDTFQAACAEMQRAGTPAALARALAAYGGDLLPGCYDEWVLAERDRLRDVFTALLEQGSARFERERDYARALACAQRLVRHEPLHESAYRILMRLYALEGNRSAALRVYHDCAGILQRDLDVAPSAATRALYERLLHAESAAGAAPASVAGAARLALVGRRAEWAALLSAWQAATRGAASAMGAAASAMGAAGSAVGGAAGSTAGASGEATGTAQAVLLVGEAGIGKTRLAEELHAWAARQGIATAVARCYAAEGTLAYAPLAALLRAQPLPPLEPVWLAELARLLPETLAADPALPAPVPLTESWQRQRLFEALARALLAWQPLLLVLDDVQWCDGESLAALHYLLRRQPDARLLLVATLRPDERDAAEPGALWPDLRAAGRLRTIELAPLDRRETGEMARHLSGAPLEAAHLERLYAETEGNPFFVLETLRAGLTAGGMETSAGVTPGAGVEMNASAGVLPPTIQAVLDARLAQLTPQALDLAGVAATVGRAFRYEVLHRASGQDDDAVVRGLDELWRRRIVREQDQESYDFSHDKLRAAVYVRLSAARRRLLHRRVGAALEAIYAADLDAVSGQIAGHLEQAGLSARAAPYHVRAGDAARRLFTNAVAQAHYQRALELLPGVEQSAVALRLGELWRQTGRLAEAEALLQRAEGLAQQAGDTLTAAWCRCQRGEVLRRLCRHAEALTACQDAEATFVAEGEHAGQCQVLTVMGSAYVDQGAYTPALECFERARTLADACDDKPALARVIGRIGGVYTFQGHYAEALACYERQLSIARIGGDRHEAATAMSNMGLTYQGLGAYPRALEWLIQAYGEAAGSGELLILANVSINLSVLYRNLGRLDDALSLAEQGTLQGGLIGYWAAVGTGLSFVGYILTLQGRIAEAGQRLRPAVAVLEQINLRYQLCDALYFQALVRARRHDHAGALALAERALVLARALGRDDNACSNTILALQQRLALRQINTATVLDELERCLALWPEETEQAALRYELWRLDPTRQDARRAAALYQAVYARMPWQLYRDRYHELTGEHLPEPPLLPEPPVHLPRHPGDIAAVLEQVDLLIAERTIPETP